MPPASKRAPVRTNPEFALDLEKYYPIPSQDLGEEGTCLVNGLVRTDGTVQEAQIKKTSGFATLDDACLNVIFNTRFLPALDDLGRPIAKWALIPITWKLDRAIAPAIMRGYVLDVGDDFYPEAARKLRQEGDCVVGVFVTADGIATDPYISKSTGSAALDKACIEAVMKAPFSPAIRDGIPTGASAKIPISWRLGKY